MRSTVFGSVLAAALLAIGGATSAQAAPPVASPPARSPRAAAEVETPPASAAFSPDGRRAVWVSEDRRGLMSATRAEPRAVFGAPDRLLTTRGTIGKVVFSPDGASIAFETRRDWKGDGSPDDTWQFIAVYDLASRRISYVDPVFASDSDPAWLADGSAITLTRRVAGLPARRLTRPVDRLELAAWRPAPRAPGEAFTLASVLAAPFIYPPGASADGSTIAYVTREARSRNLYALRLGAAARRLVSYPGDDGQELTEPPALSRTGAAIAYVRGGPVNRQGDSPDPTGLADPPQERVWLIGLTDAAPRLIGEGREPLFTPDDRYLLWQAKDLMAAPLIWREGRLVGVGAPEPFLSGHRPGARFSPDGRRLAWERDGRIEIYDLAARTTVVVPHGDAAVDEGPVWSPDGTRIAFRRRAASAPDWVESACGQWRWCGPLVSETPWSIWTVDLASLAEKRIWQARAGVGSVFYPLDQSYAPSEQGDQLLWSADGEIAFPWEGDGWRHLWAVPDGGGAARLLTPGDGEVETAALSLDRRRVIYATNIGDLGRRHLSRVDFAGAVSPITSGGDASQWSPIPLAGGALAYVDAGWNSPPVVRIRGVSGGARTAEFPEPSADFPATLLVKPALVSFPAEDGGTAFGQLFVPPRPSGCAIIFSHGGIKRQMLPGFHYMDAYAYLYALNQYLAGRGCVVLSVEYRSSIMRGEAFRDAPGWGFAGHSELSDFVGAARFLMARKDVDARRGVGVYGLSWGGYMTAELLARHSDLFSVGFDMAGVHEEPDPSGFQASAMGALATWKSPVFLAQGDDDMNVDFDQGMALARALQTQRPDVVFKQRVLPGQTHDLQLTFEQMVSVYAEGADFLLARLGAGTR
jgi:dipeptidyl aminopeptidase/acylaminoacyl peptidase